MDRDRLRKVLIENYRRIIEYITVTDPDIKNILVASAEPGEGRTTTAVGLAIAAAFLKPNKRILLVDLDLRHSLLHRMFGLDGERGMREIIVDTLTIKDVVCGTDVANLTVIPGGIEALDFPEALHSNTLTHFLRDVKSHYGMAFYDSPATNRYVDAHLLSKLMDGVLLVIRSGRSKRDEVFAAKSEINSGGGKLIGAIVNDFRNPIPSFLYRRL